MDPLHVGALWLHSLAIVTVVGYYGVLARVILPALRRSLDGDGLAVAVPAVEARALPLLVLAVAAFAATGLYLLLNDGRFTGIDLSSTWSTMIIVKHMVVLALLALGVLVDRLARSVADASDAGLDQDLDILSLAADGATALGAVALLLTAIAELG